MILEDAYGYVQKTWSAHSSFSMDGSRLSNALGVWLAYNLWSK
jgi:hypothetical protein